MALEHSDGSSADYYKLPEGACELQHLISDRDMNANIARIFELCYDYCRTGNKNLYIVEEMLEVVTRELQDMQNM